MMLLEWTIIVYRHFFFALYEACDVHKEVRRVFLVILARLLYSVEQHYTYRVL